MRLGNYMRGVGFGEYGTLGIDAASLLNTVTSVAGAVAGVALEPVDLTSPAEVAGGKLTRGFKIVKEGGVFRIVLDASIPGVPTNWVGARLTDITKEETFPVAGPISVKYIPPPPGNTMLLVALAVAGVVIAGLVLKMGSGGKSRA